MYKLIINGTIIPEGKYTDKLDYSTLLEIAQKNYDANFYIKLEIIVDGKINHKAEIKPNTPVLELAEWIEDYEDGFEVVVAINKKESNA